MPRRFEPLVTGEIYHIFNKSIDHKEIFIEEASNNLILDLISYYISSKTTISHSKLKKIDPKIRDSILKKVSEKKYFRVNIYSYCLMPTHFHFLLKQTIDNGISKFMADLINSFSQTFNKINERAGPIFFPRFKAVRIKTQEQFTHVTRYIHLNPLSSGLVKDIIELKAYRFNSLIDYINAEKDSFIETSYLLDLFDNKKERYLKFVFDNADYQRKLEVIKYVNKFY